MTRSIFTALGAATLFLTGCVASDPAPQPGPGAPGAPGGTCNAAPAQRGVGQPYSEALAQELRSASGAREVRQLGPDTMVTMEFNGDRLNLVTNAQNVVSEVRCG